MISPIGQYLISTLGAALTGKMISPSADSMPPGRPKVNFEQVPARLPAGSKARIQAALGPRETQADFLKAAVEAELKRREAEKR